MGANRTTRIQKRRIFPLPVRLYLVQSGRVARTPHFNLTEVKDVAASPDAILLSKTRARVFFATPRLAAEAAIRMLRELTESAFVETKFQNPDICDVYAYQATPPITAMVAGTEVACRAWYVKFTLLPEHVLLVSFHPLEQPIRTARGKKVTP